MDLQNLSLVTYNKSRDVVRELDFGNVSTNVEPIYKWMYNRFEMTPNYWVIVERYPFPNEVVGGLMTVVKSFLYLMEQTN